MKRLFIKLTTNILNKPIDLELNNDQPIDQIIPLILKAEDFPMHDDQGDPLCYWFSLENDSSLNMKSTLAQAGVRNNSLLILNCGYNLPESIDLENSRVLQSLHDSPAETAIEVSQAKNNGPISPQDRRASLGVPNSWKEIKLNKNPKK